MLENDPFKCCVVSGWKKAGNVYIKRRSLSLDEVITSQSYFVSFLFYIFRWRLFISDSLAPAPGERKLVWNWWQQTFFSFFKSNFFALHTPGCVMPLSLICTLVQRHAGLLFEFLEWEKLLEHPYFIYIYIYISLLVCTFTMYGVCFQVF